MAMDRDKRLYILRELADQSGLSYNFLRCACLDGRLKHIRCGVKIMVRDDWFDDFMEQEARGGGNA